jgi:CheY-like chemotaxis protein
MARIVIIEDEPTIAMVMEQILADEGHAVAVAADGGAGLDLLRQGAAPDLVLLDLYMPCMTGGAVLKAMRADPGLAPVAVVLITGAVCNLRDFPPPESYQAVLTKPFGVDRLLETVQAYLEVSG